MGWFEHGSDEHQAYEEVTNNRHKPELSHELLAGAASFEAAREYEKHVERNGAPPSHAMAKELLAGFTGAFIDREVETRGLDFYDKEKAKHQAKKRAEEALEESGDYN